MPPPPLAAGDVAADRRLRAGNGNGGRGLPPLAQAARATCRLARGAATRRGSFLTKISQVVFSGISLAQLVSCVKNSCLPKAPNECSANDFNTFKHFNLPGRHESCRAHMSATCGRPRPLFYLYVLHSVEPNGWNIGTKGKFCTPTLSSNIPTYEGGP
jgi:hypothetical protein